MTVAQAVGPAYREGHGDNQHVDDHLCDDQHGDDHRGDDQHGDDHCGDDYHVDDHHEDCSQSRC